MQTTLTLERRGIEMSRKLLTCVLLMAGVAGLAAVAAAETPLGSAFTYQGKLNQGGSPLNGPADMRSALWDAPSLGNPVGPTLTFDGVGGNPPSVNVANGLEPADVPAFVDVLLTNTDCP
jgi:hypothetical protein